MIITEPNTSSQAFGEPHFIAESIDSFSEIKIMNLIKSLKSVFDFLLGLHNTAFWRDSLFPIFSCMFVFHYVFDAFVGI